MTCIVCRAPATAERPQFRGYCSDCAPQLHAKFEAVQAATRAAVTAYEADTGRSVFEDWYAYECWLEQHQEVGRPLASALRALHPEATHADRPA